jgi:hypothetical protein
MRIQDDNETKSRDLRYSPRGLELADFLVDMMDGSAHERDGGLGAWWSHIYMHDLGPTATPDLESEMTIPSTDNGL